MCHHVPHELYRKCLWLSFRAENNVKSNSIEKGEVFFFFKFQVTVMCSSGASYVLQMEIVATDAICQFIFNESFSN